MRRSGGTLVGLLVIAAASGLEMCTANKQTFNPFSRLDGSLAPDIRGSLLSQSTAGSRTNGHPRVPQISGDSALSCGRLDALSKFQTQGTPLTICSAKVCEDSNGYTRILHHRPTFGRPASPHVTLLWKRVPLPDPTSILHSTEHRSRAPCPRGAPAGPKAGRSARDIGQGWQLYTAVSKASSEPEGQFLARCAQSPGRCGTIRLVRPSAQYVAIQLYADACGQYRPSSPRDVPISQSLRSLWQ